MIKLFTERLLLRSFEPEDWRDLYEYLSLPEVVKYEPYDVFSKSACKQEAVNRSKNPDFIAVCEKASGKLIGNLYFHLCEPKDFDTWELGYVFNPAYQHKGFATESAQTLLLYAFGHLRAHRVIAMCNPENTASWRLMERLHMRREGHFLSRAFFKRDLLGRPIWHDAYEYAVLAREWQPPMEYASVKE